MLILGVDTSGKKGSLALVRFDAASGDSCGKSQILELVSLAGGAYAATLIPQLAAMLERHGFTRDSIDAYAVATGPGSFTGLRVGISTVKALADATSKPIAAVTVLEAVAWEAEAQGRILVVLDAGRQQVFVGEFLAEGQTRTPLSEHLLDASAFVEKLKSETAPVFTPFPSIAEALLPSGATVVVLPEPAADLFARIGAQRIVSGNTVSPAELDANYIRRSDAEIVFKGSR